MSSITANILDPIQGDLDQTVYRNKTPRATVVDFIERKFYETMRKIVSNPEFYFELVLTGSLTTYQYSDSSDCDISVYPQYEELTRILNKPPNEVRRLLIQTVTTELDGSFIPGTTHPLQYFVVNPGDNVKERFKKGLRSGWSFEDRGWMNPPDKKLVHDISEEFPDMYQRAYEISAKMRILLDEGLDQDAKILYDQIHAKRTLDQNEGLGDFSEGNITYKFLLHEGLFDRLSEEAGVRIAKVANPEDPFSAPTHTPVNYTYIPLAEQELAGWNLLEKEEREYWKKKAVHLNSYAHKKSARGKITAPQMWALYSRYQGKCAYCGAAGEAYSTEHVIPLSQGGTNTIENILPTCPKCNSDVDQWDRTLAQPHHQAPIPDAWRLYPAEAKTADNFSLKDPSNEQYKYSFDGTDLTVWKVNPVTGDPHHFEKIGPVDGTRAEGRIYYYGQRDVFHMVWINRGTPYLRNVARAQIGKWVRDNLGTIITHTENEEDLALDKQAKIKIFYDFNNDKLMLVHDHEPDVKENIVVGTYEDENAHLENTANEWINANYFKRLWLNSFPDKKLNEVYIEGTHVPTRPENFMTYVEKNPAVVTNPQVFSKIAKSPWRKGRDWKDFIKNKGIIVDFQMGDTKDEKFEARVKEINKDGIRVEVAPGEFRTLSDKLLKEIKFKVRDEKRSLSKAAQVIPLEIIQNPGSMYHTFPTWVYDYMNEVLYLSPEGGTHVSLIEQIQKDYGDQFDYSAMRMGWFADKKKGRDQLQFGVGDETNERETQNILDTLRNYFDNELDQISAWVELPTERIASIGWANEWELIYLPLTAQLLMGDKASDVKGHMDLINQYFGGGKGWNDLIQEGAIFGVIVDNHDATAYIKWHDWHNPDYNKLNDEVRERAEMAVVNHVRENGYTGEIIGSLGQQVGITA